MDVGTIQSMRVKERKNNGYILRKGTFHLFMPFTDATKDLVENEEVEVFLYEQKATMHLPVVTVGIFAWVKVVEKKESIGVYVDVGSTHPIFIPKDRLPALEKVWPNVDDELYVTLVTDRKNRLIATPAKERQFTELFTIATDVELNDEVRGRIIRADREGSVMITEQNYRAFIHRTERETEPRLGQFITGRVIEVKEDGTLNVSLKPLKHERLNTDAEQILQYLKDNNGVMLFTDKSDPEEIQATFQMSKSAFKRALGRLMKQGKIKQEAEKTHLIK